MGGDAHEDGDGCGEGLEGRNRHTTVALDIVRTLQVCVSAVVFAILRLLV